MLKKLIAPLSIIALLAIGCNKSAKSTVNATAKKEISEEEAYRIFKAKESDGKTFGEKVTPAGAISYDAMLSKMGTSMKMDNVKVVGTVDAVCKAKGCWMNIASEKGAAPMFVKFKDYAFFMPKDLAGKKVVMVGNAFKEITPVEDLKHFAQDEGKTKEEIAKITKPKEEMKFMASGVTILD
ncbi:MAG: DUF4920 domain-containing protein [Saprospiraceae bacterium]|nr:DUF4920 domain-containing protein [Saprospiraceae bacterium]